MNGWTVPYNHIAACHTTTLQLNTRGTLERTKMLRTPTLGAVCESSSSKECCVTCCAVTSEHEVHTQSTQPHWQGDLRSVNLCIRTLHDVQDACEDLLFDLVNGPYNS